VNDLDESSKGSEKRAILVIILCLAVYWGWSVFLAPKRKAVDASSGTTASQTVAAQPEAPAPGEAPGQEANVRADGDAPAVEGASGQAPAVEGAVAATADLQEQTLDFNDGTWQGAWSNRGGTLTKLRLPGYPSRFIVKPIYTWLYEKVTGRGPGPWKPYESPSDAQILVSDSGAFGIAGFLGPEQNPQDLKVSSYEALDVSARDARYQRIAANGLRIEKQWEVADKPFEARLTVTWENMGTEPVTGSLWVGMHEVEQKTHNRYDSQPRASAVVGGSLVSASSPDKLASKPFEKEGAVSWFGVADRYFVTALLPADHLFGRFMVVDRGGLDITPLLVSPTVTLEPGQKRSLDLQVYAGPLELERLKEVGSDLDKAVQFGIFGFFGKILLWMLQQFHRVVPNWGVAIILLTVAVKLIFYPLTAKTFKSSKEMQRIQPLLAEAKERFKDNKELQTKETMRIMQEHKVNPMGGCLPSLIQLPVWIALYRVLYSSMELYHSHFLFYQDLSAPDPFGLLPTLYGALMYFSQRLTPVTGMDPAQAQVMRWMPVALCFLFFSVPSGLALYFCVNIVLSMLQQLYINWSYNKTAVAPAKAA
jgi:YidC/Oxa1 family membrane protein insertase